MKKVCGIAAGLMVVVLALSACGNGGGGATVVPPVKTSVKLARTGQVISYATGSVVSDPTVTVGDDGALQMGAAWPSPRFTVASSGTGTVITDNLTGLMWLQDANCANTIAYNPDSTGNGSVTWQHALDFVKGINNGTYSICGAGHTDWRLPNRKELRSLVNYGQTNSVIWLNTQGIGNPGFSNVQAGYYWSSTTYAVNTSYAWFVNMNGYVDGSGKSSNYYVWPVRSGQ